METFVLPQQLLWLTVGYVWTQPELSCIVLTWGRLRETADESLHTSLRLQPSAFSLCTQLSALVYNSRYLRFSCLFQSHCQHNYYSLYNRSGCPSWLSFISINFQAYLGASCQLYKNLTHGPHAAHGYCVKLQHQETCRTTNARYRYMKNHNSTH